ncbi:MAG: DMP19 family protein [Bacteroidaceae bacterium]|nr:DMP19 family protein [Bacteroidaceae bacterium]
MDIQLSDHTLRHAAQTGGAAGFLQAVTSALQAEAGEEITAETLQRFTTEQLTLLAFAVLRREVGEGGFIQLIHNGYGAFFFRNPVARVFRDWDVRPLYKLLQGVRPLYGRYHEELTRDMDDDEFMALYESHPAFDAYDDAFIDEEDAYVEAVAAYVDAHIDDFVRVV